MELFSYGMVSILQYLEKGLKGILIDSIPVEGPVLSACPPVTHTSHPPPALPGRSTTPTTNASKTTHKKI